MNAYMFVALVVMSLISALPEGQSQDCVDTCTKQGDCCYVNEDTDDEALGTCRFDLTTGGMDCKVCNEKCRGEWPCCNPPVRADQCLRWIPPGPYGQSLIDGK